MPNALRTACLFVFATQLCACGSSPGMDAGRDVSVIDSVSQPDAMQDASMTPDVTDVTADLTTDASIATVPLLFVGSSAGSITSWHIDLATGSLTLQNTATPGGNPSFLAIAPAERFLYAVDENASQIVSFSIGPSTHALTEINRVGSSGNGPAHVAVDRSGRWVAAANYGGGTIAVWPIAGDGSLGTEADHAAPGTNPHEIVFDPSNHFLFVPCKGSDYVAQYVFDAATGHLTPNAVPHIATAAGAGPRHLAFDPMGRFAYLINELDSTMTTLRFDAVSGTLSPVQTISTRTVGATGTNTGAEVQVHPNGRFVFGSNRGDNDIAVFAVNATDGTLALIGHQSTGGNTPRHFGLDASGAWLFVANQGSDNVVAMSVNASTGQLTSHGTTMVTSGPAFAGVFSFAP